VLVLVCEDPALVAPSLRHALLAVGTVLGLTLLQERLLGDAANRGG
jgi:hypothetical protein